MMGPSIYCQTPEGQINIGYIALNQLNGSLGIGFYRLNVNLYISLLTNATDKRTLGIAAIRGELLTALADGTEALITDLVESRFAEKHEQNPYYANPRNVALHADLPPQRLLALDEVRKGNDLAITLRVRINAFDQLDGKTFPAEASLQFQLTQSDWTRILKEMRFKRTVLLEVEEPDENQNSLLAGAVLNIRKAHDLLRDGHWAQAVVECRRVAEVIRKMFPTVPATAGQKPRDKFRTKGERLRDLDQALFDLCSLASHDDEIGSITPWGPTDARAVFAITTSLVELARAQYTIQANQA